MKTLLLFIDFITRLESFAYAADSAKLCSANPKIASECFSVHGRLSLSNGNPSVRLWKIGTRRILGVSESQPEASKYKNVPEVLEKQLSWDKDIYGDFLVCPFTKFKPGEMQFVCIEFAERISVRERRK